MMAQFAITTKLLVEVLFDGMAGVYITDAHFDYASGNVILVLEGHNIPETELVTCEITQAKRTFEFVPAYPRKKD